MTSSPVVTSPSLICSTPSSQQPATDHLSTCVQLQLFVVSPDTVTKDARVVEVTLENHSACMALSNESEMFDYTGLSFKHTEQRSTRRVKVWEVAWFTCIFMYLSC